ncbi:MAG TPA: TonB-dependent receptor [Candidatus Limnocylindria bacterium]|nr:TonB-dependent receptor [Candidatus Limnocylindria bacterium]
MLLGGGAVATAGEEALPSLAGVDPTDAVARYKQMSLDELMNQEVTSVTKQPEPYGQAPAAIQVITGDQIRRSEASNLPEALRLADNLDVAQKSSSGWAISARGFNASVGNKLLVLMDGRSLYTPLFSGVIWNMQDYLLEDLERIEVISGPGGTLWGANAVNGVINITSKSAKDTQGTYLEGGGGYPLQDFGAVRYGGLLAPDVYYRVYGMYFDRGSEVYADGSSAQDPWRKGQGGFRIDTAGSGPNQFTLQGDAFAGDFKTVPGGQGTPGAVGNVGGGNLLGRWTHSAADDSSMSLQLYYDRAQLRAPFQSSGAIPAGPLLDARDTVDLDFQQRFPLGERNRLVWGFGYRFTHDQIHAAPIVTFLPERLDQNLFNAFVQDEIRLRDDLFLTLGSKVEHNDYTGFEYEPSARLQWNVTGRQMLWGAVSRAVRTPSRYDRDLFEPSPAYGLFLGTAPSPFESENVIAYELGYRAQINPKVSGSLSVFYNVYDDLRSLSPTPGAFVPLYFSNFNEGDTYGFELSADYQILDWWRLHGGYDFLREDIHAKPGQSDFSNGLAETADPENQVFLRSSMDLPGRLELDVAFRWIDTIPAADLGATRPVMLPDYAEMSVRLCWHATPNLDFSVVGQNLLHDQHAESGVPGAAQEQIVRSFFGKVAWSF